MTGDAAAEPAGLFTDLDRSLGHLVRRAQRVHTAIWSPRVAGGLTSAQYAVLTVIAAYPQPNQGMLGEVASLDKSTTADVVSRLVRNGWIRPDEGRNGRGRVYALTPPGEISLPAITAQALDVQAALLEPIPPAEQEELVGLLARVAYADDAEPPSAPLPGSRVLDLASTPTHLLRRVDQRSQRIWSEVVGRDATPPQYAVFCAVRHSRLDQRTVAGLASIDPSNAGDVLARLAQRGLVSVDRHPADRRRSVVELTSAAFALLPGLTRRAEEARGRLLAPLGAADGERLRVLMRAIAYR